MINIKSDSTTLIIIVLLAFGNFSHSLVPIVQNIEKGKASLGELSNSVKSSLVSGDVLDIDIPEDATLDIIHLIEKYGHTCEEHEIISSDGYITKLFHIPGNAQKPALLWHGIFDSASALVIRGNDSMGITLADNGYDVWLGNMRGNKYSRTHQTLDPDTDSEYWNFSYHEMALYDLPPTIDYILEYTGQAQIYAIAHSQGNSIFCAMTSMLPEYNEKIRIFIALAPAVYIQNIKLPTSLAIQFAPLINYVLKGVGQEEILANSSVAVKLLSDVCPIGIAGYIFCAELILFSFAGYDRTEIEQKFVPVIFNNYPSGTSRKNLYHLIQSALHKRFAQYDAGDEENLKLYGTKEPPTYNLTAVTMNVAIFTAQNDKLVVEKDTARLSSELPNVVEYRILAREKTNHIDFVWGKNAKKYLFPYIFDLLEKY